MSNNVNHPPHYTAHPSGIECIQITEHMNFNLGNAMKYIWRADMKNGAEDLEKAAWYIQRELDRRNREKSPGSGSKLSAREKAIAAPVSREIVESLQRASGSRCPFEHDPSCDCILCTGPPMYEGLHPAFT